MRRTRKSDSRTIKNDAPRGAWRVRRKNAGSSGRTMMDSPRLTRYELEIMDVVWKAGEATVQDVCDGLKRTLAYTTVMTTLTLLESKKKVLERTKRGRAFVYRPLV